MYHTENLYMIANWCPNLGFIYCCFNILLDILSCGTYNDKNSWCVFIISFLSWVQDKCYTIPECNSITAVDDKPHDTSSQTSQHASFDTCSFGCTQFFCISVNLILMFRIEYILHQERTVIGISALPILSNSIQVFIYTQLSCKDA